MKPAWLESESNFLSIDTAEDLFRLSQWSEILFQIENCSGTLGLMIYIWNIIFLFIETWILIWIIHCTSSRLEGTLKRLSIALRNAFYSYRIKSKKAFILIRQNFTKQHIDRNTAKFSEEQMITKQYTTYSLHDSNFFFSFLMLLPPLRRTTFCYGKSPLSFTPCAQTTWIPQFLEYLRKVIDDRILRTNPFFFNAFLFQVQ